MGKERIQGILWSLVLVVILLSFMTPFLIFTISFIMVPMLMLQVKLDTKSFALHYIASLFVVFLAAAWQGPFLIAMSLFFLPTAMVMGNLYKRKAPARTALTAGVVMLLGESLLTLVIGYFSGFNPIAKFRQSMNEYISAMPEGLRALLPNDQEWYVNLMVQAIPLDLIVFAAFYVFVSHGVARRLLNKSGATIPGLKPMRDWMLPKSFVWMYLLAFILDLFIAPGSTSLMAALLLNLLPILIGVFAVQAIAFLFHVAYVNRWSVALPVVGMVVLMFVPPLLLVYSLLGVFDAAFPIRERFKKNI